LDDFECEKQDKTSEIKKLADSGINRYNQI
jgi:hypothetical protein